MKDPQPNEPMTTEHCPLPASPAPAPAVASERPDIGALVGIETSIVIPSYRRPDGLARALASCLAQEGVEGRLEIIVVDNDADGSAQPVVAAFASRVAVPIRYIAEPRPGISHARNTGVAAAAGYYLAFLDDDEEADPGWLAAFLSTIRRFGADIVVGPVYPNFPATATIDGYPRKVYTRDAEAPTGTPLPRWAGIGNSLLDKGRCFAGAEPFAPRYGLTGGEDTIFLRQLTAAGRKLLWCAEAAVHETVPADRLAPRYLLHRAFRGGQTATYVCAMIRPRQWGRAIWLMVTGSGQAVVFGPPAVILRLFNRAGWLLIMAKAASGLGKVLWHPSWHFRMYR